MSKFYATANSILRNFKQTNIDTLLLLFNSYCKPVYGLNIWCNKLSLNSGKFKAFEVAYMKTLKRILGVPMYSSNHETAGRCEQLLLRHHIASLQAKYYHRLCSSRCFLVKMNMPFLKCGLFYNYIDALFREKYGVGVSCHASDILLVSYGYKIMRKEYLTSLISYNDIQHMC